MKKLRIEKQLIFADTVKAVSFLHLKEALQYQKEADGIRAIGPLYLNGSYEGNEGIKDFEETLDMDILAPNAKLTEESFYLEIAEYYGEAEDDVLNITIMLNIHGLKEEEESSHVPMKEVFDTVPVIEQIPNTPLEDETKDTIEATKENQKEALEEDLEDLFGDDESTYTSYRIIVAKPNDTYSAIAQRYEVDEITLREVNQNKEILPKTLVILPFYSD